MKGEKKMRRYRQLLTLLFIFSLVTATFVPVSAASSFSSTESLIKKYSKSYPKLSVYYRNLVTGETYTYQPTKVRQAASTIKLPLVLYVYELAAKNKLNLNERLTYKKHHYYGGSGVIQNDRVGTTYTISDLVYKAITYSDNIAFIMLRERVGKANFIQYAKSIGGKVVYPNGKNMTTAADLATYMNSVWNFSKKYPDLGNKLVSMLSHTVYNETVASSLKPDQVAHKVGYIPANLVYNDVALVKDTQPYILVVTTEGIPVGKDVKVISAIADSIHKEHTQRTITKVSDSIRIAQQKKARLVKQILIEYNANVQIQPYAAYNEAKKSLQEAKKLVATLPDDKQTAYKKSLADIEVWIGRAANFIDAISAGRKLDAGTNELKQYLQAGDIQNSIASYHSLSSLQKRQAVYLYKPYGKTTREEILSKYKGVSQVALEQGRLVVLISDLMISLEEAVASGDKEKVDAYQQEIEEIVLKVQEKVMRDHLVEWVQSVVEN